MRWERTCAAALCEELEAQVEGDIPLQYDALSHSETVLQVLAKPSINFYRMQQPTFQVAETRKNGVLKCLG